MHPDIGPSWKVRGAIVILLPTGRLVCSNGVSADAGALAYLRANGFKTFIVSGGGVEFMRPWTERVYGIPPEQVVGSSGKLKLEVRNGVQC